MKPRVNPWKADDYLDVTHVLFVDRSFAVAREQPLKIRRPRRHPEQQAARQARCQTKRPASDCLRRRARCARRIDHELIHVSTGRPRGSTTMPET
jgi:hypothetical protein